MSERRTENKKGDQRAAWLRAAFPARHRRPAGDSLPHRPTSTTPFPSNPAVAALTALTLLGTTLAVQAQGFLSGGAQIEGRGVELGYCEDDVRRGWHFYCDRSQHPDPEPEKTPDPQAAPAPAAPPVTATQQLAALSAALEEIKARAVLEPTPQNLEDYMGAQMAAVNMAGQFAAQWQQVLFANPHLDRNVTNPVSSLGGEVYQDALVADRRDALIEAAQENGFLLVLERSETCPVCALQSRVVAGLAERYGITILAVSTDGAATAEFSAPLRDTGQLARLGLADVPRPTLALVHPASDKATLIGAGALTEDMILQRVYAITRTTPETRFAEGPLARRQGTLPDLTPYATHLRDVAGGLLQ